jgi:YidC/Oxa1 family membrane protein insertase
VRHEPEKFDLLKEKFKDKKNITVQTDFSSNNPVLEADVLITDWSDISFEFAFVTKRPVLFINTPMKIMNQEYEKIGIPPITLTIRTVIGEALETNELGKTNEVIDKMLREREEYSRKISEAYKEHVYNIGKSTKLCGKYIIKRLNG